VIVKLTRDQLNRAKSELTGRKIVEIIKREAARGNQYSKTGFVRKFQPEISRAVAAGIQQRVDAAVRSIDWRT
jgi:hypothetical protein